MLKRLPRPFHVAAWLALALLPLALAGALPAWQVAALCAVYALGVRWPEWVQGRLLLGVLVAAFVGLLLGAGLPAIFAIGLKSLDAGQRGSGGGSTAVAARSPLAVAGAVVCFAVVLIAIVTGILFIMQGFLSQIEISQQSNKTGKYATGLGLIDRFDLLMQIA